MQILKLQPQRFRLSKAGLGSGNLHFLMSISGETACCGSVFHTLRNTDIAANQNLATVNNCMAVSLMLVIRREYFSS